MRIRNVVVMASTSSGSGYWLATADGGIFAYNAPFLGSTGSIALNKPIVGLEANADGIGYRFSAADGGVFTYGTFGFSGPRSLPRTRSRTPLRHRVRTRQRA